MNKKVILRSLVVLTLFYPAYMLFRVEEVLEMAGLQEAENEILNYQISIWISWVILSSVAIFYKWTERRNSFFFFTYGFILVAFSLFGYLYQSLIIAFDLPSDFKDSYTLGIFVALQNIVVSVILTAILQTAVWWFTRRWHRRYT